MTPPLAAQLYALLHRGNPCDLAFYRRVCAGGAQVLELGVGYGRLAIPLARSGSQIVGLDLDPQMLALAAQEAAAEPDEVQARLTFTLANMTRFALERRFDRVLIPYNSLCCVLEPTDVQACLQCARDHLTTDGLLALDVYRADDLHDRGDEEEEEDDDEDDGEPIVALEHEGVVYRVYEESHWQRAPQRLDTCYRFVPQGGGEILEQTIRQRYLLQGELDEALKAAGLQIVERSGGFAGEPVDDDAEQLVLIARRA